MSQYRLWEGSFSFLRLTGDCYWEIQGTIEKPEKIYLLRPDRIQASLDAKLGVREYLYWPRGNKGGDKPVIFAPNEIVHFKTFNPLNEFEGLSPLNPTKLSIAADLLSQKYNVKFFENDATPHGVYMTDQVLNTDKLNLIEEKIIKFLQNTRNKFSPIILHGGLKYQPVSMGPKDAEFATGRDLNRQDILSGQRVPPAVAGISNQNFAESNLQSKIFRQYRLLPMLRAMQADLDNLVLQHLGPNLHCMFDVQDVEEFRDEMVEQELRLRTQFDRGIIGINEYRKALRLPLVNEKLGSKRFILSSLSELTEDGVILAQPHTSTPQESKEEAYTHLNKELLELLQR
jgi:HK97 family phage portal protein